MSSKADPDLFTDAPALADRSQPLAAALRPTTLQDFVGQQHLLGPERPLGQLLAQGKLHSMVLWGPPGCGKTSLARLLAAQCDLHWISLSAVLSGVKDIRAAVAEAQQRQQQGGATALFVDEVHRFNKAQQDAFLPHVESGTVTFIGATTENPSFELNSALLSRARVYVLKALEDKEIGELVSRALRTVSGVSCSAEALTRLCQHADGDARRALNVLEIALQLADGVIDARLIDEAAGERRRRFDKGGDLFYDQISALHKAVRGSDPDAALYWFCRMLDGGAPPEYLARRLLRMASEDIGNADPRALSLCLDAWQTFERLGSPEGDLALAQALLYMASVPKSNAVYNAFGVAQAHVKATGSLEVPHHLRNAPTQLGKELGYGKDYRYAHDEPDAYAAGENYWPDGLAPEAYYQPVDRGLERKIAAHLAHLAARDSTAPSAT